MTSDVTSGHQHGKAETMRQAIEAFRAAHPSVTILWLSGDYVTEQLVRPDEPLPSEEPARMHAGVSGATVKIEATPGGFTETWDRIPAPRWGVDIARGLSRTIVAAKPRLDTHIVDCLHCAYTGPRTEMVPVEHRVGYRCADVRACGKRRVSAMAEVDPTSSLVFRLEWDGMITKRLECCDCRVVLDGVNVAFRERAPTDRQGRQRYACADDIACRSRVAAKGRAFENVHMGTFPGRPGGVGLIRALDGTPEHEVVSQVASAHHDEIAASCSCGGRFYGTFDQHREWSYQHGASNPEAPRPMPAHAVVDPYAILATLAPLPCCPHCDGTRGMKRTDHGEWFCALCKWHGKQLVEQKPHRFAVGARVRFVDDAAWERALLTGMPRLPTWWQVMELDRVTQTDGANEPAYRITRETSRGVRPRRTVVESDLVEVQSERARRMSLLHHYSGEAIVTVNGKVLPPMTGRVRP